MCTSAEWCSFTFTSGHHLWVPRMGQKWVRNESKTEPLLGGYPRPIRRKPFQKVSRIRARNGARMTPFGTLVDSVWPTCGYCVCYVHTVYNVYSGAQCTMYSVCTVCVYIVHSVCTQCTMCVHRHPPVHRCTHGAGSTARHSTAQRGVA